MVSPLNVEKLHSEHSKVEWVHPQKGRKSNRQIVNVEQNIEMGHNARTSFLRILS
jgi:hypothetical protein